LIETGADVVRGLDEPKGFWAVINSSRAQIMKASLWFLSPRLGEAFPRKPRSAGIGR
jgi:hypothetical protein